VDRLSSASKLGTKAYACIFSHVPSKWRKEGVLAYHGIEIPYVFGDLERLKEPLHFYIFARPSGATRPDPGLTEEDKWVAEAMMTMWVQFAKNRRPKCGRPSHVASLGTYYRSVPRNSMAIASKVWVFQDCQTLKGSSEKHTLNPLSYF
jgi:para-nitrobenzyl esterase